MGIWFIAAGEESGQTAKPGPNYWALGLLWSWPFAGIFLIMLRRAYESEQSDGRRRSGLSTLFEPCREMRA